MTSLITGSPHACMRSNSGWTPLTIAVRTVNSTCSKAHCMRLDLLCMLRYITLIIVVSFIFSIRTLHKLN